MSESDEEEERGNDLLGKENGVSDIEHESFRSRSFSLSSQLISNLERRGLTIPTKVQREVIPKIRNVRGRDLCVNAPTGSGKTLAYALPIVEVSLLSMCANVGSF
jgi:superfamily II DNA/RNA helicase